MKTFVVRVFVAADGSDVPFCGVVEPVGSGPRQRFRDADGLIRLVRAELERTREPDADAPRDARPPPAGIDARDPPVH